jgi:hypothetical protein
MGPAVSRRSWCRPLLVLAVVSLILAAGVVVAQTPASLRIVHNIDKPGPTHAEVSGRVYNDGTADALDVYVNVAAVDGAGKVLAQGISYVGAVPVRGSTPFKARVPVVAGTSSYRVGINSFRFGIGRESP